MAVVQTVRPKGCNGTTGDSLYPGSADFLESLIHEDGVHLKLPVNFKTFPANKADGVSSKNVTEDCQKLRDELREEIGKLETVLFNKQISYGSLCLAPIVFSGPHSATLHGTAPCDETETNCPVDRTVQRLAVLYFRTKRVDEALHLVNQYLQYKRQDRGTQTGSKSTDVPVEGSKYNLEGSKYNVEGVSTKVLSNLFNSITKRKVLKLMFTELAASQEYVQMAQVALNGTASGSDVKENDMKKLEDVGSTVTSMFVSQVDNKSVFRISPYLHDSDGDLEQLLGSLWFSEGEFKQAAHHLWRACLLNPRDPRMFTHLGLAYQETFEYAKAVSLFEYVLELPDVDKETVYCALSCCIVENLGDKLSETDGNFDDKRVNATVRAGTARAVECLEKCLEINNRNHDAVMQLAQIRYLRRDFDECESIFNKIVQDDGSSVSEKASGYSSLGQIEFKRGNIKKSIEMYRAALDLTPNNSRPYMHLCEAQCADKQIDEAMKSFRSCIEADKDDVELHALCGLPICNAGHEKMLLDKYQEFLDENPDSIAAKTFRRSLGIVGGFNLPTSQLHRYLLLPTILIILLVLFLVKPYWDLKYNPDNTQALHDSLAAISNELPLNLVEKPLRIEESLGSVMSHSQKTIPERMDDRDEL